ncbi:MAG: lipid A deacylase LpxR family protein [Planctomycetota bacterium]
MAKRSVDAQEVRGWAAAAGLVLAAAAGGSAGQDATGGLQLEFAGDDSAIAEQDRYRFRSFNLTWSNDAVGFTGVGNRDRHFTNGVGLEFAWDATAAYSDWERWLPLPKDFEDPRFAIGFNLRQYIFTPSDIGNPDPQPEDWPWAGWLTIGLFVQRADDHKFDHLQLDLGLTGESSLAEAAQEQVHALLSDQIDPAGWGNQLSHEFTFNLQYERRWKSDELDFGDGEGGMGADLIPYVGGRLGNVFIDAEIGVIGRLGLNLPDTFGPASFVDITDHTGLSDDEFGIYAFGRLGGRVVARNLFLDGNIFQDSTGVDRRNFVGELQGGFEWRWNRWYGGWSFTVLTEELDEQNGKDFYGTFTFGYVQPF